MHKMMTIFLLISLSFHAHSFTKDKVYKLTILHTNDHHGRFWTNSSGELGLAARATIIKGIREEVKKEGGHLLLLDAGDVNTGIPQSDLQKAEPDFKGMAMLGYDVMAVGNHEFDNPVEVIKEQQKWAGFPFISANIYLKNSNERLFPSHISKQLDDLKVTVFGLTTEDTPLKTNKINTEPLIFKKAFEEAKEIVPGLRKEADILIALTHVGHYPNESHGMDAPGDVTIARQVKGIDLIVGGHTQKPLFKPDLQNGTIIVQAYEWGKYVGRVDLEFLNGKIKLKNYQLIPVNLTDSKKVISQDADMLSFLKPYKEKGDKKLAELSGQSDLSAEVGHTEVDLSGDREVIRSRETNLGNLITEAFRKKIEADISIINSGGIRDSIRKGKITNENLMTVLPFKGRIVSAQLTGDELQKYLETIVLSMNPGSGSFPQISNAKIYVNRKQGRITKLLIGGKNILKSKMYTISLPEFVAKGGDKYPAIKIVNDVGLDVDILREFIANKKRIYPKDFTPIGYIINE